MRRYLPTWLFGLSALLLVGFVACGETTSPTSPSGSSGASGRGTLSVRLTDLPYDAGALLVTFSEVSAHLSEEGWQPLFKNGEVRTCDLKRLENGAVDEVVGELLLAGHYTQLRLTVEDAALYFYDETTSPNPCVSGIPVLGGGATSVEIPSGEIKLNRQFTIEEGGTTTILLDFDGDRSVKEMGNNDGPPEEGRYRMDPVISVVGVD